MLARPSRRVAPGGFSRRFVAVLAVVPALLKLGIASVVIEAGAGQAAGFTDAAYVDKGATIGTAEQVWAADLVTAVRVLDADPQSPDLARVRPSRSHVPHRLRGDPAARPRALPARPRECGPHSSGSR